MKKMYHIVRGNLGVYVQRYVKKTLFLSCGFRLFLNDFEAEMSMTLFLFKYLGGKFKMTL